MLIVLMWHAGILFTTLYGDNHSFFRDNCIVKNISFEDFKACVKMSRFKTPLIESVGIKSFEKQLQMNEYSISDMILPYNGSIGVKTDLNNPTFMLNSSYTFALAFFDRDYFLYVSNPLIVNRSILKVLASTSPYVLMVGIEVSRTRKYIVRPSHLIFRLSRTRRLILPLTLVRILLVMCFKIAFTAK